jgi:hypothetical protein
VERASLASRTLSAATWTIAATTPLASFPTTRLIGRALDWLSCFAVGAA